MLVGSAFKRTAMDAVLQRILTERLNSEKGLPGESAELVLAACQGTQVLAAAIRGETDESDSADSAIPRPPVGAYLQSVAVQGFRGIGGVITLPIDPGPGLTLVFGRNGSGKSSLAEALEFAFTGDNLRWSERSAVWREGWRNLHESTDAHIRVDLVVAGFPGTTSVKTSWLDDADLEDFQTGVEGGIQGDLAALGWQYGMVGYRPFLSYSELGSMLEKPSRLFDALSTVLGLEDLVRAGKALAQERKTREDRGKKVRTEAKQLIAGLEPLDDERARRCLNALREEPWNLGEVDEVLHGFADRPGEKSELETLRRLAMLEVWPPEEVDDRIKALRQAAVTLRQVQGTDADSARQIARLLESAVDYHAAHGDGDCPICGQPDALDATWLSIARARIEDLRKTASEAEQAHRNANDLVQGIKEWLGEMPAVLERASALELDSEECSDAWSECLAGKLIDEPELLAEHISKNVESLRGHAEALRSAAKALLDQREDAWRPVARSLTAWLRDAQDSSRETSIIGHLRKAETWLKGAEKEIRDERFAPIADEAMRVWEKLRVQSNVELGRVHLEGTGRSTRREVSLDVTVDGIGGPALGVMSQGELHSLALSLFLPRATLPESPFRFVVIDDPVQSMDPARVEGLAQLLDMIAKDRQLLLFTHDDRLYEAIRRLQIKATVWEVTRRPGSVVELRRALDPVRRYIKDARVLAMTTNLPSEVASRVVPGFCRLALEAACIDVIRRRLLSRGKPHSEVEQLLESVSFLLQYLALVFFENMRRVEDVWAELEQKYKKGTVDLIARVNKGSHEADEGDLHELVTASETFAKKLLNQS